MTPVSNSHYRNETADAQRPSNGWYRIGDLGYIDESGFPYFACRRGDWIRVGGGPDPRSGVQVTADILCRWAVAVRPTAARRLKRTESR